MAFCNDVIYLTYLSDLNKYLSIVLVTTDYKKLKTTSTYLSIENYKGILLKHF